MNVNCTDTTKITAYVDVNDHRNHLPVCQYNLLTIVKEISCLHSLGQYISTHQWTISSILIIRQNSAVISVVKSAEVS